MKEQLKAFIDKVQADTSLQEQLKAEGADPVAIAKAAGFAITTEDSKADRQLSEEELESVAGGWADKAGYIALQRKERAEILRAAGYPENLLEKKLDKIDSLDYWPKCTNIHNAQ